MLDTNGLAVCAFLVTLVIGVADLVFSHHTALQSSSAGVELCFDDLCKDAAACSVALFVQVVNHGFDLVEGGILVLGLSIAVLSLLTPKGDDHSRDGLADDGTTTGTGELRDFLLVVVECEHVLLSPDSDSSLGWVSVALSGANSAEDLVDLNLLDVA